MAVFVLATQLLPFTVSVMVPWRSREPAKMLNERRDDYSGAPPEFCVVKAHKPSRNCQLWQSQRSTNPGDDRHILS